MADKKKPTGIAAQIQEMKTGSLTFHIKGITPYVGNALTESLKNLFLPKAKKTAADKASTLKHNPVLEYRQSVYTFDNPANPTLVCIKAAAIKQALIGAATDIPGFTRAQLGRLIQVDNGFIPLWGKPSLVMMNTRQAGMTAAPDVSTKAIFQEWATSVVVRYQQPLLTADNVIKVLAAAGIIRGIGDGRPENGKLSYGQFEIAAPDDPDFKRIVSTQGYDVQEKALFTREPEMFDDALTHSLWPWFQRTIEERGLSERLDQSFAEAAAAAAGK